MRLDDSTHLTYCTNVHPGETLAEVLDVLERHVPRVKARVCPHDAFGVGLRLSSRACEELTDPRRLEQLRALLDAHGLYVFTLNGFPYGAFHGTRVKERVYEPDWRSPARLRYTNLLADILVALLPAGVPGSVSTVPCAWRDAITDPRDEERMAAQLIEHAHHLFRLRERTGHTLALALEPEPGCLLETTAQCVRFFEDRLWSREATERMAQLTQSSASAAEDALRRHLGVCVDTCHAAVEFEEPADVFRQLDRAGLGVKKLQLSAGLRIPELSESSVRALGDFVEDVYLHQTVERRAEELVRYTDLPEAMAALAAAGDAALHEREWRVHFHVPLFVERYGLLESTQGFVREVLELARARPVSPHLEVETYTWDVLPSSLRSRRLEDDLARELDFVMRALSGTLPP